jgi:polygalacturonase
MKKITFWMMCLCLWMALPLQGSATDYSTYYQNLPVELAQPELPQIPEYTVNITDFGGQGDGLSLNTEAFAKAIEALSAKGGGHLVVPAGIWLTGPITLKSHIDLHLERNALLLFSPDKSLYVDNANRTSGRCYPGLSATRATDISITGEGIIDGNGAAWRPVKREKVSDVEWKVFNEAGGVLKQGGKLLYPWEMKSGYADIAGTPEKQEAKRNDLFRINHCERVLLQGVTFQNAPKFHVHPLNCRSIVMDGITVRCPWNAQNGDAIDLSDCHRALIVRCTVDAGDDGLCMKSGRANEKALVNGCEDILIEDNTVFHAHGGFVIGSESVSGLKRLVVRNCRFSGTDTGLRFKSGIGRGGQTEDIYISDIVMNDIKDEAIIFQCTYVDRPAGSEGKVAAAPKQLTEVPEFKDIHISNVTCVGAKVAISAAGIEGQQCVHDIEISNSTFVFRKEAAKVDEATAQVKLTNVQLVRYKAGSWPK